MNLSALSGLQDFLPLLGSTLAALALAFMVHRLARRAVRTPQEHLLSVYYGLEGEGEGPRVGSWEHRIRLAFGERVAGRESEAFWLAVAGVAAALGGFILLLPIPAWMSVLALPLAHLAVRSWIEGRWKALQKAVEKDLPFFLRTLAAMLPVTPNVPILFRESVETLDHGPLREWLERLGQDVQKTGLQAFARYQDEARALSLHLAVLLVLLRRLWETGGTGFQDVFVTVADALSDVLEARGDAEARASEAASLMRIVALSMGGALVFMMVQVPDLFAPAHAQMALLLALGVMVFGWFQARRLIQSIGEV